MHLQVLRLHTAPDAPCSAQNDSVVVERTDSFRLWQVILEKHTEFFRGIFFMSRPKRLSTAFSFAAIAIVLLACLSPALTAQSSSTSGDSLTIHPPEHPVTRDQLQAVLAGMKAFEAQRIHLQEALEAQHKTLPAWFPDVVWNEVVQKIEAINIVDIDLPIYQKYLSQDQANAMILLFQGPTGELIGRHMSERALDALHTGARGSAADAQAIQAGIAAGDNDLWTQRFSELTPEQRDKVLPLLQSLLGVWKQIDDEQDLAFDKRANEIFVAVQKTHQPELRAAMQAANKPNASQTTPH
jgi:hypothetical protein